MYACTVVVAAGAASVLFLLSVALANTSPFMVQTSLLSKAVCRQQQRTRAADVFWQLLYSGSSQTAADKPGLSQRHLTPQIDQVPAQVTSQTGLHHEERSVSSGNTRESSIQGSGGLTPKQPVPGAPAERARLLTPRPQYRPPPSTINSDGAREAMKLCNCFDLTTDELGGVDRVQKYFIEPLLRVPGTGNTPAGEPLHLPPHQLQTRYLCQIKLQSSAESSGSLYP